MRTLVLILTLITVSSGFAFGQTPQDTISIFEMRRGYHYFKGDKQLNANEIAFAVRSNEEAYQMVKSARSHGTIAMILGYVGGAMVGWSIGTIIGGGNPNWFLAGTGVAVVASAYTVGRGADRKLKQAVDLYNEGLGTVYLQDPNVRGSELRLSLSEFGIGVTLSF